MKVWQKSDKLQEYRKNLNCLQKKPENFVKNFNFEKTSSKNQINYPQATTCENLKIIGQTSKNPKEPQFFA